MNILYENSLAVFIIATLLVGGGGAFLTGRAVALTWRPFWTLIWFTFVLALFVRFLHFALWEGTLLSAQYFIADLVVLLIIAYIGYRMTRTTQMVTQYSWLYKKSSPFTWQSI